MREILFRGRRTDNGEWVTGTPIFYVDRCKMTQVAAVHVDFIDEGCLYYSEGFPVDPETVGQYTGLADKNGKRIFEGDILEYQSDVISLRGGSRTGAVEVSRRIVKWGEYGWNSKEVHNNRWTANWNNYGREDHLYKENACKFATVIGNIHDNPELLED